MVEKAIMFIRGHRRRVNMVASILQWYSDHATGCNPMNRSLVSGRGDRLFSFPKHSDRFGSTRPHLGPTRPHLGPTWAPLSLIFNG